MYVDNLKLSRAMRSGRCDVCGKRRWHRGRAVAVRLIFRAMPAAAWLTIVVCNRCLDNWSGLLRPARS